MCLQSVGLCMGEQIQGVLAPAADKHSFWMYSVASDLHTKKTLKTLMFAWKRSTDRWTLHRLKPVLALAHAPPYKSIRSTCVSILPGFGRTAVQSHTLADFGSAFYSGFWVFESNLRIERSLLHAKQEHTRETICSLYTPFEHYDPQYLDRRVRRKHYVWIFRFVLLWPNLWIGPNPETRGNRDSFFFSDSL